MLPADSYASQVAPRVCHLSTLPPSSLPPTQRGQAALRILGQPLPRALALGQLLLGALTHALALHVGLWSGGGR